ncbi:hypothetical protein PM082_016398 [Marasmius tenuissimus]|nr:hypothetical protein PM082_016398 [Marasmius tenuissimus]
MFAQSADSAKNSLRPFREVHLKGQPASSSSSDNEQKPLLTQMTYFSGIILYGYFSHVGTTWAMACQNMPRRPWRDDSRGPD